MNMNRYLRRNWKLEDLGYSRSTNTKGVERRQVKKKAFREYRQDFDKE